ncbi:outer membrane protein assembly factor BamB family protein [Flindersiella endophytica]
MVRRRKVLVAVLVVVIVGVVGASIVIVRLTAGPIVWSAVAGAPAKDVSTLLAWTTNDLLVSAGKGAGAVVALDKGDGSVQWKYRVPGAEGEICTASSGLLKNAAALSYRSNDLDHNCRGLLLLDLGTGKPKWNLTFPRQEYLDAVEVAGDRVIGVLSHSGSQNVLVGFDPDSGVRSWVYESECQQMNVKIRDVGFDTSPRRIAFADRCWHRGYLDEARVIDPGTGQLLHRIRLDNLDLDTQVLLASPLVVYETRYDYSADPETSSMLRTVHMVANVPRSWSPGGETASKYSDRRLTDHSGLIGNRYLLVVTAGAGWAAWDLVAGKDRWSGQITERVDGKLVFAKTIIATDGRGVIATGESDTGKIALLRIDADGKAAPISGLLELGRDGSGVWLVDKRRAYAVTGPGRAIAFRTG